jgi:hypothetical protein
MSMAGMVFVATLEDGKGFVLIRSRRITDNSLGFCWRSWNWRSSHAVIDAQKLGHDISN